MEIQTNQHRQSVDAIVQNLCKIVTFPSNLKHPPVFDYSDFTGKFRDKLQFVLDFRKQKPLENINYNTFVWKRCEVGELTGNQFLRALAALNRNCDVFYKSVCIVLTIHGKPDAAMFSINDAWWEIITPSPDNEEERRYYDKIFDEKKCRFMQSKSGHEQHFSDEKLSAMRNQVSDKLHTFLHNPIAESSPEFRHAFVGMLQELVKAEYRTTPVSGERIRIPVASCVWLAIHHSMSHKLQAMFGDHWLPLEEWKSHWIKENPNIANAEIKRLIRDRKAMLRFDAAIFVIKSTIQIDRNGRYNNEKLKEVVDKVKAFYQISAED